MNVSVKVIIKRKKATHFLPSAFLQRYKKKELQAKQKGRIKAE